MATYPPDTKPGRGAGCSARQTVLSPPRGSLSRSPPRPRARRLDGSRLDRVPCSLRAGGSLASGIHESGCSQSICKRALLREGCRLRRPAARAHLFVSSRKSGSALFRPGNNLRSLGISGSSRVAPAASTLPLARLLTCYCEAFPRGLSAPAHQYNTLGETGPPTGAPRPRCREVREHRGGRTTRSRELLNLWTKIK